MNALTVLSFLGIMTLLPSAGHAQDSPLAKPLRKFDQNKDGKLTGEELVLARQAHNRGGKELEFDARRMREFMDRRKAEWKDQQKKFLDTNGDGKVEGEENRRADTIWTEIEKEYDLLRKDLLRKYDKNDDAELNGPEREASRSENNSRRNSLEQKVMDKFRQAEAKPNPVAKAPVPGTPTPASP